MLIDEKGRILKRFNIIDFLVIVLIVVAIIFSARTVCKIKNTAASAPFIKQTAYIWVRADGVLPEVSKQVKEGDMLINEFSYPRGVVKDVISRRANQQPIERNGQLVIMENPLLNQLMILIEAELMIGDSGFYYQDTGVMIKAGKGFQVQTKYYYFTSIVTRIKLKDE